MQFCEAADHQMLHLIAVLSITSVYGCAMPMTIFIASCMQSPQSDGARLASVPRNLRMSNSKDE